MNAPRAPVISCIIEPDALHSQTAFYNDDVQTRDVRLITQNYYYMTYRPKSYICADNLIIQT